MRPPVTAPFLQSNLLSSQKDLEISLVAFIKFAHAQSQARRYSYDQTLHLLDRAWEAQKLLWQLRYEQQCSTNN